ncbi:MAG: hypothetical protein H7Y42_01690 [Chitinophagaceae bacterium]|nr:hypothetical protein [Chitinophagaceae bacterium]
MKRIFIGFSLLLSAGLVKAQKVDSIFFNLYTDSLKKGTHNYINVDGKMSDGTWRPLTSKDIIFTSSSCEFNGNELVVPADFKGEKITVKAVLKSNPSTTLERTIWIKVKPDPLTLPTNEEILRGRKNSKGKG